MQRTLALDLGLLSGDIKVKTGNGPPVSGADQEQPQIQLSKHFNINAVFQTAEF